MSDHADRDAPRPQDAAEARDAATVMPLRDGDAGLEVFMVRRHSDSGFMADRYVYPGGQVDPADCTERAAKHTSGITLQETSHRLGGAEAMRALGLHLAGVRETYEEAGILLAHRAGAHRGSAGDEPAFVDLVSDPETRDAFETARVQLQEGELALTDLLDRRDLVVPLNRLGFFAHWITPYLEERRYDTYFFVVDAPEHQAPLHDAKETTDSLWTRPAAILEANRADDVQLAPPTLRTLERLDQFETVDDAMQAARDFIPPTQLPHIEIEDGDVMLYLPGDPAYPADEAAYAVGEAFEGWPTRLRMAERGRWVET